MIRIEKGTLAADTFPSSVVKIDNCLSNDAREVIYRFLAWLFLYPDPDRVERLRAAAGELCRDDCWRDFPFSLSFKRLFDELSAYDEEAAGDVINEYNRLFFVKPKAPPYESYYLDSTGQFRGWISARLEGEYAKSGLAISPSLNEMPDHLAVELEFMSYLCSISHSDDSEVLDAAIEGQRAFLTQHLAKWFPKFAKRVKEARPQYHYGVTVEASFLFLRSELALLVDNGRCG